MSKSSSQIKKDAEAAHASAAHEHDEVSRSATAAVAEADAAAKANAEAAKEYGAQSAAIRDSSDLHTQAALSELAGHHDQAVKLQAQADRVAAEAKQHHDAAERLTAEGARHSAEYARLNQEETRHDQEATRLDHNADDLDRQTATARAAEQRYAEAQAERPHAGTQKETDLSAAQAEQARADAVAARQAAADGYEHRAKDIAEARDEAALSAAAADQGVRAAQMQVKHEERMVADAKAHADHLSRSADAVARSNPALAESYREQAATAGVDLRVAQSRLDSAHHRASAQAELAKDEHDSVQTLEKQYQDLQSQRVSAEKAVDGMEERARLLEQAKQKLADAETNHDPKLQAEAQALVEQAQRIHVDPDAVGKVAPPTDAQQPDAQPTNAQTTGTDAQAQGPVTHPDNQDASPTATDPQGEGPVTHPDQSAGDPATQPTDATAQPTSGTPTTEELRTMATEYSNAAQSVHKERVDLARTTSTSDHDRDVQLELNGTRSEIDLVQIHTTMYRDQLTGLQTHATQLQKEAEQLFRHGKSPEAEEKQEEADVAAAQVDRTAGLIKDREQKLTELQAKADSLDHEWKASRAVAAEDQARGEQLEKTADKLDDVAHGVGDAYRARLDADDLRARAAQAGIDPQQKAQLEQQAQAKESEANQLLTQAQQQVPADDDVARKALQDAGVPAPQAAPAESTPAASSATTPAATPAPPAPGTDASATPVPMDATSMDAHDGVAAAHPAADADAAASGQSAGTADIASTQADVTGIDAHEPGSTTPADDASGGAPAATSDTGTPVQVTDAGGSGDSGDAAATHQDQDVVGIDGHDSAAVPSSDLDAGQPVAMDHDADAGDGQAAAGASDDFNHVEPGQTDAGQVEPPQEFHDDQQVADAAPPADSYDSFADAHAGAPMDTGSSDDDGDYA
ncbi:MAG: hypothetical protein ACJ71Z_03945 [Aeromicrobium sp.]